MTQAERTRTIKYVLAESIRWLLHRRRDMEKINIPGCRKKNKKRKKRKNEKRKVGSKAQKSKQENRTQGVKSYSRRLHSNKSSRLCYKAGTGTLPHHLPSSSRSRRQRYQVSLLPLSSPPPRTNQRKPNKNCPDSGAVATQVPLSSRTGTLPHDLNHSLLIVAFEG